MTYSSSNIRTPKGESRGTGRDYRGRFQPSYVEVIRERLVQHQSEIDYCQKAFDEAQEKGDAQRIGYFAVRLDRARKQAGRFELIIAEEEKGVTA